jgi:hypothetical protein
MYYIENIYKMLQTIPNSFCSEAYLRQNYTMRGIDYEGRISYSNDSIIRRLKIYEELKHEHVLGDSLLKYK